MVGMFKDNPFHKALEPVQIEDPTNPKDLIGQRKPPMSLLPGVARVQTVKALENGAAKYGRFNWRSTNVRMSIYLDAIERHLIALADGEDVAEDSGISHLGHIMAGAAILLDAAACGTLIDDRPPAGGTAKLLKECIKHAV